MALEGANVLGSNVVYNTNNSLNTYNKAIQQQQLKAQAEQKSLMEELGSVKADGIREKDIPGYNARFQKWRDSSIQASKETDPEKKMILQSNESRNKNDLSNFTVRSNDQKKLRAGIGTHYVGKDPLEDYTPTDWDKYRKSDDLSIDDPNYVSDLSQFQIRPDVEGFTKSISTINDNLLKTKGIYQNPKVTRQRVGNQMGTMMEYVKTVDPQLQIDDYKVSLLNPAKYKAAQQMYPTLASQLPKDQFIEQVSKDLAAKNPISVPNVPQFIRDKSDPKEDGGADAKSTTYRQKLLDGIINNNTKSFDEAKAYMPQGAKISYETSKSTGQSKGGYNLIRLDIPAGVNAKGVEVPPLKEDISLSKGDYFNRLNNIVSLYTGEQISPSKANIVGGKQRGEQINIQGTARQPQQAQSTSNQTSGYSNSTSLKGVDGKVIKAGIKNGKWYNTETGKEIK